MYWNTWAKTTWIFWLGILWALPQLLAQHCYAQGQPNQLTAQPMNDSVPIIDIGVASFLSPLLPLPSFPNKVKVVVQNFGNVNVSDFDIAYGLPGGYPINVNFVDRTVPAGDTIHHTFNLDWIPIPPFNNPFCHLYA